MEEKAHHNSSSSTPDLHNTDEFDMEEVEPAILTDLWVSSESQTLSLAEFYQSWDPVVINHHPDKIFSDIRSGRVLSFPKYDFSRKLVLSTSSAKSLIEDIYKPSEKSILFEVFSRSPLTPRLRSISVVAPLEIPVYDSVDIRRISSFISPIPLKYPDIFIPDFTVTQRVSRFWNRYHNRVYIGLALSVWITTLTVLASIGLALYARDQVIVGYESLSVLNSDSSTLEVNESISNARSHFRRAQIAFIPTSVLSTIAPRSERLMSARHAIDAGLASTGLMEEIQLLREYLAAGMSVSGTGSSSFLDPKLLTLSRVGITDIISENPSTIERKTKLISQAEYHFSEKWALLYALL